MSERQMTGEAFYQYLAEQKLMGSRCRSCGALHLPPRPLCPACYSDKLAWEQIGGRGKLVAFTTILGHFMQVPTWKVLIGVIGAELASIMPFHGVAGSGSYELVTVAALVPFGVSGEAALTGALNLHLFLLGSTILLGIVAVLLPGRRLLHSEKMS